MTCSAAAVSPTERLERELADAGRKPYYIPAGASDHPLGGLGFARWALEVEAQERELGIFFDTVIVCAVTGSTFAGSKCRPLPLDYLPSFIWL